MVRKSFVLFSCFCALAVLVSLADGAGRVTAAPACDPVYVKVAGNVFTVLPTGSSDTANLQCAFDAAVMPGANIRLAAGTYYTGLIVVNNFQGEFTGAGMGKTRILNLPGLYVTPVDFYFNPPSATNPGPFLLAFINGKVAISNLAIHIRAGDETTGWSIFGIDPPIEELAAAIVFEGTHIDVSVDHILVEGEPAEGTLFGYSIINGIYYEGFIGEVPTPVSGSFRVANSIFRGTGSGSPVQNVINGSVVITHNTYENVGEALDGGDFTNTTFEFSNNQVNADFGLLMYNMFQLEEIGSTFILRGNQFLGQNGPFFDQTFGEGNRCLIMASNTQQVSGVGVYLGPGTHDCTVVGGGTKTSVLDLGTGNILTGVNNMGVGVGPQISTLMKMRK